MSGPDTSRRHLGLLGATGIGVGGIAGGSILALAGIALQTTGPSAIVAFALNGCIALLAAVSFAELAARFPRSGGTYLYARQVLTVEAASGVGWIVWFASVVAAVFYAMGFSVFLVPFLEGLAALAGREAPVWIGGRFALVAYALIALSFYLWRLTRSISAGGRTATLGKVLVFAVLIVSGFLALAAEAPTPGDLVARFEPFFLDGLPGLFQAMGYTFIAFQGFELITAMSGEVRDAARNVPRAMFLSLGVALAICLPVLFLVVTVGMPGGSVVEAAAESPETLVAEAARAFMGQAGYWLIAVTGLLSMIAALQANLLAASRFAQTMAADRTMPRRFARLAAATGTPTSAVRLTVVVVAFLLLVVPDVAGAAAAASLVLLAAFALTHAISYLARRRAGCPEGFRSPWFPTVPVVGGSACLLIGLHQAVTVPLAGVLAAIWLSAGALLYALYLGPLARVADASAEALDPEIIRFRGRQPVVLAPIANPASAPTMVAMAGALAPRDVGRVQLLSVVAGDTEAGPGSPTGIADAQAVLGRALAAALELDLRPEATITVNPDPWVEIARVAEASRTEKLLLGVGHLDDTLMTGPLARLISNVDADVSILRAPPDWTPARVRSILVPSRGGRDQSPVRARLLGSLMRSAPREVTFLGVLSPTVGGAMHARARRDLERLARDEAHERARTKLVLSDDVVGEVARLAADTDLLILGFHWNGQRRATFSARMLEIARATTCPLLLISHRRAGGARGQSQLASDPAALPTGGATN